MRRWAVFRDDEQVSKAHMSRWAAMIEAYEMGIVVGTRRGNTLPFPYSIRALKEWQ